MFTYQLNYVERCNEFALKTTTENKARDTRIKQYSIYLKSSFISLRREEVDSSAASCGWISSVIEVVTWDFSAPSLLCKASENIFENR